MQISAKASHTLRLIQNIERHHAPTPMEQTHKLQTLYALKTAPDILKRSCENPGHVTVTGWITNPTFSKLYLINHPHIGILMPAGGHLEDSDPDTLTAIIREVWEELALKLGQPYDYGTTGIFDIDSHQVAANPKKKEGIHLHYNVGYLFVMNDEQEMPPSPEGIEAGWWTHEECKKNFPVEGGRYRCLQKIKSLRDRY